MYKLTVIAGPNRGTSYAIQDGESSIGRQSGNTILLQSSKVSKKHCVLVVDNTGVVIKDQGSSNGTFVNGILTKARKITIGDRISVGEYVMELVESAARAPRAAPPVAGIGNVVRLPVAHSQLQGMPQPGIDPFLPAQGAAGAPQMQDALGGLPNAAGIPTGTPKDLKGKVIWFFEHQVMPVFYGLNLKHEWRLIVLGLFGTMVVGNLVISVYPLLQSNQQTVVRETARRAQFMARQIANQNAPALAAHAETKTDVGAVDTAAGVRVAVLTDLENRILAPSTKLNSYLTSGPEATLALSMSRLYRNGEERGTVRVADGDTVVAIEPVKVLNPALGKNVVVGMAIVSIDTSLSTPDLGEIGVVYSETLTLTGILACFLFFVLYRLTLKPFQVLNEDMDKVLKGDMGQVTREFKFEEMNALWDIINSALQRVPKGVASGLTSTHHAEVGIDDLLGPIRMMGGTSKHGVVACDAERKIAYMNPVFEEISGIRLDSVGQELSAVARDQALAALVTDLLSRAPVGDELVEDFDFSGISYKMHVSGVGLGGVAKGYVIVAVKVADE